MNNRDLDFLNLRDLKSVAKYYRIEHKSRIKRVELEALIYMAEHIQALEIIQPLEKVEPNTPCGGVPAVEPNTECGTDSTEEPDTNDNEDQPILSQD